MRASSLTVIEPIGVVSPDVVDVLQILQDTAAEVVMPLWRHLDPDQIHEKAPGDKVTDADRAAEVVITARLREAFPDAVVLGEEATETEPGLFAAFEAAEHAFTLDPIDGTHNFVDGSEDFAVMAAELRRGQVVRSWIWQPAHEVAWVAERGAGVTRNGVAVAAGLRDAAPALWRGASSRADVRAAIDGVAPAWGCCGVDYPNLVAGVTDFLVYSKVMPWDHAPGSLMVTELGGALARPDGSPYRAAAPVAPWLVAGITAQITAAVVGRVAALTA